MKLHDQIGNEVSLLKTPRRIVCLVPSITELLVDLGLEEFIVGVTKFCIHPKYLKKQKTIIGGTKKIKFEILEKLDPDFIICNKEENTKDIVKKCKAIAPTYISDIQTISNLLQLINHFGKALSCEEKAKELIYKIQKKNIKFSKFIEETTTKKVAYVIWKNPIMVVANNTYINHLITLNNFENAFKSKNRYPETSISELQEIKNLDYLFLSSEPYPFNENHVLELQNQFKETKVILVDGEAFSWYGSHILFAYDYFKKLHKSL